DDETFLCYVNIGLSHTPVRLEDEWPLMTTFHHIFVFGATPFLPEDAIQLASTVRWKSHLSLMVGSCQSGVTPIGSHWLTCNLPIVSHASFSPSGLVTIQLTKLRAEMKPSPNRTSGIPDPALIATAPFLRSFATTPVLKKSLTPQWPQGLTCSSYMTDYTSLQARNLTFICYDSGITDNNVLGVGNLPLRVTGPFEVKLYHPTTFLCVGSVWGLLDSISVTTLSAADRTSLPMPAVPHSPVLLPAARSALPPPLPSTPSHPLAAVPPSPHTPGVIVGDLIDLTDAPPPTLPVSAPPIDARDRAGSLLMDLGIIL
ncbi:MAG: hypothetical protein Q8P67_13230, partial [archaeon]|nr:hypothetical protein [archaeon]